MDRKDFFKAGCNACLLGAAALFLPRLAGCAPAKINIFNATPVNNRVELPLQVFDKGPLQLVRPMGWVYDIAVHKKDDGSYMALLMQCTHMNNQLNSSPSGYACSLHGSQFNADGEVVKGPAETALRKYVTTIENGVLVINL
jgi:Rieske Fe-S protein